MADHQIKISLMTELHVHLYFINKYLYLRPTTIFVIAFHVNIQFNSLAFIGNWKNYICFVFQFIIVPPPLSSGIFQSLALLTALTSSHELKLFFNFKPQYLQMAPPKISAISENSTEEQPSFSLSAKFTALLASRQSRIFALVSASTDLYAVRSSIRGINTTCNEIKISRSSTITQHHNLQ